MISELQMLRFELSTLCFDHFEIITRICRYIVHNVTSYNPIIHTSANKYQYQRITPKRLINSFCILKVYPSHLVRIINRLLTLYGEHSSRVDNPDYVADGPRTIDTAQSLRRLPLEEPISRRFHWCHDLADNPNQRIRLSRLSISD